MTIPEQIRHIYDTALHYYGGDGLSNNRENSTALKVTAYIAYHDLHSTVTQIGKITGKHYASIIHARNTADPKQIAIIKELLKT